MTKRVGLIEVLVPFRSRESEMLAIELNFDKLARELDFDRLAKRLDSCPY